MKLDHYPTPYTKINSQQIKNLTIRPETIKLLEENISGNLLDMGFGDDIFNLTLKAKATKVKINKWNLHQTKKLLHSKGNHQQNEKEEKICKSYI